MKKLFVTFALLAVSTNASAGLVSLSGSFSGLNLTSDNGINSLSGNWSGQFDDSAVTGVGLESFAISLSLGALNHLPTIAWTPGAASGEVRYVDGAIDAIVIGGILNGVGVVAAGSDDWVVVYDSALSADVVAWATTVVDSSISDARGDYVSGSARASAATVPEPGTLGLLGVGLLALGLGKRNRQGRTI